MPRLSQTEGENFTMNPDAMREAPKREPLEKDHRFVLWIIAIVVLGIIGGIGAIGGSVVAYQYVITPEKLCAQKFDPPEFCRELAKRGQP